MEYKFISPLRIVYGEPTRKTRKPREMILNMNVYRNTHYRILNIVKARYVDVMEEQINKIDKILPPIELIYTYHPGSNRSCDVTNVCSIHSKFFLDSLVELGKLEDDNYKFVPKEIFRIGNVDKENPRVEIVIRRHNPEC